MKRLTKSDLLQLATRDWHCYVDKEALAFTIAQTNSQPNFRRVAHMPFGFS